MGAAIKRMSMRHSSKIAANRRQDTAKPGTDEPIHPALVALARLLAREAVREHLRSADQPAEDDTHEQGGHLDLPCFLWVSPA
jgi:hypothetical protein